MRQALGVFHRLSYSVIFTALEVGVIVHKCFWFTQLVNNRIVICTQAASVFRPSQDQFSDPSNRHCSLTFILSCAMILEGQASL